jgi:hypothetical protein
VAAGCGAGGEVATPTATLEAEPSPTEASPTATPEPTPTPEVDETEAEPTEEAVSYEVPAEVTIAYIDDVLGAFDTLYGDAMRALVTRGWEDGAEPIFFSAWTGGALELWTLGYGEADQATIDSLADDPLDPRTTVEEVLLVEDGCIVVAVDRDLSPLLEPGSPGPEVPTWYMALIPKDETTDPQGHNPTPWQLVYDGYPGDGNPPAENPCL